MSYDHEASKSIKDLELQVEGLKSIFSSLILAVKEHSAGLAHVEILREIDFQENSEINHLSLDEYAYLSSSVLELIDLLIRERDQVSSQLHCVLQEFEQQNRRLAATTHLLDDYKLLLERVNYLSFKQLRSPGHC